MRLTFYGAVLLCGKHIKIFSSPLTQSNAKKQLLGEITFPKDNHKFEYHFDYYVLLKIEKLIFFISVSEVPSTR